MELFVEEPHLVADHRNFPVLVLDLGLKVLAVLLLRVKPVQNLIMRLLSLNQKVTVSTDKREAQGVSE